MNREDFEKVWKQAFQIGFYAGFAATGEGWNAEYPFETKDIDFKTDKNFNEKLEEALERTLLETLIKQDAPSFVTHGELANVVSQIADAIRHKMQADNLDGLVDRLRDVTTKEQA